MKKRILIIILVLILLAGGFAGGYWYYQNQYNVSKESMNEGRENVVVKEEDKKREETGFDYEVLIDDTVHLYKKSLNPEKWSIFTYKKSIGESGMNFYHCPGYTFSFPNTLDKVSTSSIGYSDDRGMFLGFKSGGTYDPNEETIEEFIADNPNEPEDLYIEKIFEDGDTTAYFARWKIYDGKREVIRTFFEYGPLIRGERKCVESLYLYGRNPTEGDVDLLKDISKTLRLHYDDEDQWLEYKKDFWGVKFIYPEDYIIEEKSNLDGSSFTKILSKETKNWEQEQIAKCEKDPGNSSCGVFDALYVDALIFYMVDMNTERLSLGDWILKKVLDVEIRESFVSNTGIEMIETKRSGLEGDSVYFMNAKGEVFSFNKLNTESKIYDVIIRSTEIF